MHAVMWICTNCNVPLEEGHICPVGLIRNEALVQLTLPTDSAERKSYPLYSGCLAYFPAALAGVAKLSKLGNDKHNPGQSLHHARGKSSDHADCIVRHLIDLQDLLAARARGTAVSETQVLSEASAMAWRSLAYAQELHEAYGAPLAPGAKDASR